MSRQQAVQLLLFLGFCGVGGHAAQTWRLLGTHRRIVTANTLWYPKPLDLLETGGVRIGA